MMMDIREVNSALALDGRELDAAKKLPGMMEFVGMHARDSAKLLFVKKNIRPDTLHEIRALLESMLIRGFVLGREFETSRGRGVPIPTPEDIQNIGHIQRLDDIINEPEVQNELPGQTAI